MAGHRTASGARVWGRAYSGPGRPGDGVADRKKIDPLLRRFEDKAVGAGVLTRLELDSLLEHLKRIRDTSVAHVDGSAMPIEHLEFPPIDARVDRVWGWWEPELAHALDDLDLVTWRRFVEFLIVDGLGRLEPGRLFELWVFKHAPGLGTGTQPAAS